jgi:hypothetical protein
VQIFKRCLFLSFSILQLLVLFAATVKPAHAYVDPGSGLLFFQVGGSMLAGALFVLRARLRKLFGLKPPASKTATPLTDDRTTARIGSQE